MCNCFLKKMYIQTLKDKKNRKAMRPNIYNWCSCVKCVWWSFALFLEINCQFEIVKIVLRAIKVII